MKRWIFFPSIFMQNAFLIFSVIVCVYTVDVYMYVNVNVNVMSLFLSIFNLFMVIKEFRPIFFYCCPTMIQKDSGDQNRTFRPINVNFNQSKLSFSTDSQQICTYTASLFFVLYEKALLSNVVCIFSINRIISRRESL